MGTRIATDETREAIKTAARQHGGLAGLVRHLIAEYPDIAKDNRKAFYRNLYDARHGRAISCARENQVRFWLDLDPIVPPPVKRVAIDPTTEGVRKLPGHGDTPYRTMAVKMSPDDYDMLMSKFARIGCKSLQDYVDTVMLENGSEAA